MKLRIIAVLLPLMLLSGCFVRSYPEDKPPENILNGETGTKTYAVVFPIVHPFFEPIAEDAQNYANENNWTVYTAAPEAADYRLQIEIMRELIDKGVDGIAIGPTDPDELVGVINEALDAGIKVICFETDAPDSDRMGYVGTNNYNAGRHMGYAIGNELGGEGKILILTGLSTQMSLNERIRGIKEYLSEHYPGIEILNIQSSEGDAQQAVSVAQSMIEAHPDFDAIIGIDATAGPAAVEVWKANGWNGNEQSKLIITFDDMPDNLQGMRDGYIRIIISQRQNTWGQGVLMLLDSLVEGRAIPDYTDTGSIEITMNNIDRYLNEPSWVEP